jgi:hypothetical protein
MKTATNSNAICIYWYGDLARYTGESRAIHGGMFFEVELMEGHMKGQKKWTQRNPSSGEAIDANVSAS